jgi:acetyltransferase EpsM
MQEVNVAITPIGYLDDNPALAGKRLLGLPVLRKIAQLPNIPHDAIVVAIGDNATRQRLFKTLGSTGEPFVVACHPSAIIAPDVELGPGSMICAGAVVNPGSVVGANTILNIGCVGEVDVDARYGEVRYDDALLTRIAREAERLAQQTLHPAR